MLFIAVRSTASIHKAHEAGASRVQFIAVRSTASIHKAHEAGASRVRGQQTPCAKFFFKTLYHTKSAD